MSEEPTGEREQVPSTLSFRFVKGQFFRAVHVDGAFGGLSPKGDYIHMTVFNERVALPNKIVNKAVGGEGASVTVGEEISREVEGDYVREFESELIMDLEVAKRIRTWLDDKIGQAEERVLK